MERYQSLFVKEWHKWPSFVYGIQDLSLLEEAVIEVKNYLNQIENIIKKIKKDIKNIENNEKLVDLFNKEFQSNKIKFLYEPFYFDLGFGEYGINIGLSNKRNGDIFVKVNLKFAESFSDNFNHFLKSLLHIIGHELVHRGQTLFATQEYLLKLKSKANEDESDYFSDKQEIMSYAWQIIEELRFVIPAKDNKELKEHFKNFNFIRSKSIIFDKYMSLFSENDYVIKRLVKYIYQYLDNQGKEY